jgi:hypothetical protein
MVYHLIKHSTYNIGEIKSVHHHLTPTRYTVGSFTKSITELLFNANLYTKSIAGLKEKFLTHNTDTSQ